MKTFTAKELEALKDSALLAAQNEESSASANVFIPEDEEEQGNIMIELELWKCHGMKEEAARNASIDAFGEALGNNWEMTSEGDTDTHNTYGWTLNK